MTNNKNQSQEENQTQDQKNQQSQDQQTQKPKKTGCFKKFLIILALIILLPFAYCQIRYPSYTYKYKVTVEVETPQGVKSGSSVVQVHSTQPMESLRFMDQGHIGIKGEGTIVDIAEGKTLFVLLNGAPSEGRPHSLIYSAIPMPKDYGRYDKFYGTLKNAKGILPRDKYPRMVYFEDISKPISVKEVNPDNMAEFFGEGVKIKQITVETTKDKLEWKMVEKLPWLPNYYGISQLDGNRYSSMDAENRVANSLGAGSFLIKD